MINDTQVEEVRNRLAAEPFRLFIDGEWSETASGAVFDVLDPATGRLLAKAGAGGAADVDRAVKAARRAFETGPWARMGGTERAGLMQKLGDALIADLDELALIESLDGGNPINQILHFDIPVAVANLRQNAGWIGKIMGDVATTPLQANYFSYTMRQPVGVVGAITPWNAPFLMALGKIGPALAAGCTVVLKPAELAPLSALRLGWLIEKVGFPPGVVNIVTGLGADAGQALVDHPDVNKISFTGSTRVGRSILAGAAGSMKRVTLELGGKSPIVVFPDADIDAAAAAIAREMCFKTGQYCAAGTRLFAHDAIHDELVEKIAAAMQKIKTGPAVAATTQMGPIISDSQLQRVMEYIAAARAAGATVATGGNRIDGEGWFVEPTLLTDVTADMRVARDEVFGPVLSTLRFSDSKDFTAIAAAANNTEYGLAAKVWTRDLATAHAMARRIDAGVITVNGGGGDAPRPFGGFKQSGIGREGGLDGVLAYTETKSVSIAF